MAVSTPRAAGCGATSYTVTSRGIDPCPRCGSLKYIHPQYQQCPGGPALIAYPDATGWCGVCNAWLVPLAIALALALGGCALSHRGEPRQDADRRDGVAVLDLVELEDAGGDQVELEDAGRELGPDCSCLGLPNCCCTIYDPCSSWTPTDGANP